MEFQETSQGSFTAWGTGLTYAYNAYDHSLSIVHRERHDTLAHINFDSAMAKNPLGYVELLEKATQIKALIFSNHQTIDLADMFDAGKLKELLKPAFLLSRYAFDLDTKRYHRFCRLFCEDHALKSVKIKRFISEDGSNEFFIARIQTQHDNGIIVRGCTMAGLTAALSDRTLRDLITMEFGHRFEGSAQNLLRVSSQLSTLSCLLDEVYCPIEKIKIKDRNTLKSQGEDA